MQQPPKKIKKVCKQCGKTFEVNEKNKGDRKRIFCDQDCYDAHRYAQDIRTCPICHKTFPTFKSTTRKYCSIECTLIGLKRPRNDAECICLQCGKEFYIPKAWVRRGDGKYCSKKCHNLAQIKDRVNLVCGYCGKDFEVRSGYYNKAEGTGRFCSVDCYNNDRAGLIKLDCEHCGKKFEVLRANLKKEGVGRYCSIKCTLESRLPTSLEIRGRDKYLKRKGYTILRFWEHEVYKEEEYMIDTIKQCINSPVIDKANG